MKRIWALFLITILLTTGCRQTNDVYQRAMIGETFCLSGTSGKYFYQLPSKITEVYGYDSNGCKVIYNESDYVVDYDIGIIRRTEQSHIPDYQNHKVNQNNDGKFDFVSEPRNPELNVLYQVHVNYTYRAKENHIENKSYYLSKKTISKLEKNKSIKIAVVGDSISCGAQTTGQYFWDDRVTDTFAGLIKRELENAYGCIVDLSLVSYGGTDR